MRIITIILTAALFAACGPSAKDNGDDGTGDDAGNGTCSNGAHRCTGNTLETCENGTFVTDQDCPLACDTSLGCVTCMPGTGMCNGNTSHACLADGSGYEDITCDPVEGSTCDTQSGLCIGDCAPQNIGTSYIGCEYYPTVTGNPVSNNFHFAVVVANASNVAANVTIEDGGLPSAITFSVAPNSLQVQTLAWNQTLKLCNNADPNNCVGGVQAPGAQVANGAFHLRSNEPVTVYQFNPLEYTNGQGTNSYSNDASLLLPTNVWRNDYYAAAYHQTGGVFPSELAVTALQDNTQVTINTRANTPSGGSAPAFTAGTPQTVTLNAGDVLELTSIQSEAIADLTGSHVVSDKPVQLISGHYCVYVPDDSFGYCDHVEESMFSVDALGDKYVVNAPAVTTIPNGKVEVVRFIATAPDTTLTYDPPQSGAPTTIANAGDFVEIVNTAASFVVTANHKVYVAQYMEGSTAGGGTGDPSMALAVPVDQFRTSYLFHAPTNYETNYVDVTAPTGATVMLDGAPLTFTAVSSEYGLARVTPLGPGPNNDGNHTITGSDPFGITVYGYGQDTSYWYPGGLDLSSIPVE